MKEVEIPNPQLWDTEHPNLYRAEVTLMTKEGKVVDQYAESFGIRTIEYGPQFGMKLNGKKVLLQGLCQPPHAGCPGRCSLSASHREAPAADEAVWHEPYPHQPQPLQPQFH